MTIKMQCLNADGTVFAESLFEMPVAARNRILDAYRMQNVGPAIGPANPPQPIGRKAAFKKMAREFVQEKRRNAFAFAASEAARAAAAAVTPDPEPTITESVGDA